MNRRVNFSPEPSFHTKHGAAAETGGEKKRIILKIWIFKLPKGSSFAVSSFFKNIGEKAAKALPPAAGRRCSRKVSSANLARSRSYAETLDSQRAEAIEDCIEFLNSSSSSSCMQRSTSMSSSC